MTAAARATPVSGADAARERLAAGDPRGALALLQQQVRAQPGDARLRVFLFQLFAVLGDWQRAAAQAKVCGELDAALLPLAHTSADALQCEALRAAVFAGTKSPLVFGPPAAWIAGLVQALQADAGGDAEEAQWLRSEALDAAPPTAGTLNGEAFDWIADADTRLGPVLEVIFDGRYGWLPFAAVARVTAEPPADLRDLVWLPASIELHTGARHAALLPARYPGVETDAALLLARRTEWREIGPQQYSGAGQRVIASSASECGLLEVREIVLCG